MDFDREADAIEVTVNGEQRAVPPETTIEGFLAEHDLEPDVVVVERNGEILPRKEYGRIRLESGDELEIVHFVGGG